MSNVVIYIEDSGTGKTGLSLSFTTYINQNGTSIANPSITELGAGFYQFSPVFSTLDLVILYAINTAYSPAVLYAFLRHEDFGIDTIPTSPQTIYFPLFNSDYSIATGQSLSFATYTNQTGSSITSPSISEVGGGFYQFSPIFTLTNTSVNYVIETMSLIPQITYSGALSEEDFSNNVPVITTILEEPTSGVVFSGITNTIQSNPYGIGISATDSFPVSMNIIGGTGIVIQAIYRRFITDSGALAFIGDNPSYGLLLANMVNDDLDDSKIAWWNSQIVAQCLQEETVFSARSEIEFDAPSSTASVVITVSLFSGGTFQLVLSVNNVSAQLMEVSNT